MENGVINICHGLPDGLESSICALETGGEAESRVDTSRVGLFHVPRMFGNDPTLALRLARLFRRERIDILHTHNWVGLKDGLPAAKLAGVPLVVHGEHGRVRDRLRQKIAQRFGWKRVDRVLSVSAALADRMSESIGFPRDQVQVISNGVDTDRFSPRSGSVSEARTRFGLPVGEDVRVAGMVARLVDFKNHEGVLRAVSALRQSGHQVELVFAGSGPLEAELRHVASSVGIADSVHFLGELHDVRLLYHALDIVVSNSSHNEGMSNSILEAMASAVPVIATDVAASSELLDGGAAGLLVPPRDDEAVAEAIGQMITDAELRQQMGDAARARAESAYSLRGMVSAYAELYEEMATSSGLRGVLASGSRTHPASVGVS